MSQYHAPAELDAVFKAILSRLSVLERTKVSHGNGPPPTGFVEPYVDDTNSRVYFYVNGVAKSVALT